MDASDSIPVACSSTPIAEIASSTLRSGLSKVLAHPGPPAVPCVHIRLHCPQTRSRSPPGRCRRVADASLVQSDIARCREEQATSCVAIPSSPTCLLDIRLKRSWYSEMADEPDMRMVDPHSERAGRHDYWSPPVHECLLDLQPARGRQPCVVGLCAVATSTKSRRYSDRPRAGRHVDDRSSRSSPPQCGAKPLERCGIGPHLTNSPVEIRAVHRVDKLPSRPQAELILDIGSRLRSGCRSEGRYGRSARSHGEIRDLSIGRTKVMSPFADAVRLIDYDARQEPCWYLGPESR
jgi:hypothetical protein